MTARSGGLCVCVGEGNGCRVKNEVMTLWTHIFNALWGEGLS